MLQMAVRLSKVQKEQGQWAVPRILNFENDTKRVSVHGMAVFKLRRISNLG
jgi:hypothetical protein